MLKQRKIVSNYNLSRRSLLKLTTATGMSMALPFSLSPAVAQSGNETDISWAQQKKRIDVLDMEMAYIERGEGRPIIFLHGNPTSSYLWRNIIPHVQDIGRCIAPDLIGLGDSGRYDSSGPGDYGYEDTRKYLLEFMEKMDFKEKVTLVVHDWGSTLGFDWAKNNASKVAGISYMAPLRHPASMQLPPPPEEFSFLYTEAGEQAALNSNLFVETMIDELGDHLSEEDRDEYRRPFVIPGESRRATITWPRLIPFGGIPESMKEKWIEVAGWMAETEIPKLFFRRETTQSIEAAMLENTRSFKNQTEVAVFGGHYVQEISPNAIGRSLADWILEEI
jgi:haloalkane dehalogenase